MSLGSFLGNIVSLGGLNSADQQAAAANQAAAIQSGAASTAAANTVAQQQQTANNLNPYIQSGQTNLGQFQKDLTSGAFTTPYGGTYQDTTTMPVEGQYGSGPAANQLGTFNFSADPGAAYRQQQSTQATENSAAAKGLLGSSSTLNNINANSSNNASQEYNNAYQRYQQGQQLQMQNQNQGFNQNQQQNQFNLNDFQQKQNQADVQQQFGYTQYRDQLNNYNQMLQNKYNVENNAQEQGLNAAGSLANFGAQANANANNYRIQGANAQASGLVGAANAEANVVPNAINSWTGLVGAGAKGLSAFNGIPSNPGKANGQSSPSGAYSGNYGVS